MKILFSFTFLLFFISSWAQTSGLVGYYPFSGNAGDSSGQGNHGTVNGATLSIDRFGSSNKAYLFNGSNNNIEVTRMVQNDFSICVWFKSTQGLSSNPSLYQRWYFGAGLVDAEVASFKDDFGLSLNAAGQVLAGTGDLSSSNENFLSSDSGYNNNQWHFAVFTRNQSTGTTKLYVDANLRKTTTGNTKPLNASNRIVFGMLQTGVNAYSGSLDDIRIYNREISLSEVQQLFGSGSNGFHEINKTQTVVYPNPTTDFLYISDNPLMKEIRINDISGKELLRELNKERNSDLQINIKGLPNGIYFLQISGDSFVETIKIVISR